MSSLEGSGFIPVVRLDNTEAWRAVEPRLKELVLSGGFTLGPPVRAFEEAAARAFGSAWAVGTSSGTSALVLALRASPLRPGSRVAVPANAFYAVFEAVVTAGHVPVITDHDEDHLISAEILEPLDVHAVLAVHMHGLPVDMEPVMELARERHWWVLEDGSQAHGAAIHGPVGSLGHAAAFSAYPTKNLGAWGDAGFVTGSDLEMRDRIRSFRHHAQPLSNIHEGVGGTHRLDALQALVLTEKLRGLPEEVRARREAAIWYREGLAPLGLDLPGDRGARRHAFHHFVIRVPDRERVREALLDEGIETAVHYPTPIHLQPGAKGRCDVPVVPHRAEAWAEHVLTLPMFPGLTGQEVQRVVAALKSALR